MVLVGYNDNYLQVANKNQLNNELEAIMKRIQKIKPSR